MKTKLLVLTSLISFFGFSQTSINSYYSADGSTYAVVTSTSSIDQTASGDNLTWNFINLSTDGTTTTDSYTTPTANELTLYPGTTSVMTITSSSSEVNKIFTKMVTNAISFTGVERTDLMLNYTDNALIGTFPMSYNTTGTDAVAGNFDYNGTAGAFTGTITSTVDAYGTLNMNDLGFGDYSGSVTRLKIVQNLTMLGVFPASQTTYYYFDSGNGNLVFRTNNINVAALSVDETIMESYLTNILGVANNEVSAIQIKIVPNVIENTLNIYPKNNTVIRSVIVTDINGRVVLKAEGNTASLSATQLKSGLYFVNITTENGRYVKKFIKK